MRKISLIVFFLALMAIGAVNKGLVSSQDYQVYVVQQEDTWSKLAIKFSIPMEELAKFNGRSIEDTLFAGQGIKIPLLEKTPEKEELISTTITVDRNKKSWESVISLVSLLVIVAICVLMAATCIKRWHNRKQEPKETVICKFEDESVRLVICRKISGMILCPICSDFQDPKSYQMSKHLKGHYNKGERRSLFKEHK